MARQGKFRIIVVILTPLIALLSCVLPGTTGSQLPTEITESVYHNYVPNIISSPIDNITSTPQPVSTSTLTNVVVIIQSSSTPEQEIILLRNFFVYVIRDGDTFVKLAESFCGDEHKFKWLLQVNGMEEGELLSIGREVIISCTEEDR